MRTYTLRRLVRDADAGTAGMDVVMATHPGGGPGARLATDSPLGTEVVVIAPGRTLPPARAGVDLRPGTADHLVLAGDETAAPAICASLEDLPVRGATVEAFVEVPSADDVLPVEGVAGRLVSHWTDRHDNTVRLTWLPRRGDHGDPLVESVRDHLRGPATPAAVNPDLPEVDVDHDLLWEVPADVPGGLFVWVAGEAAMVRTLRHTLVGDLGIDRSRVAFMGYWRRGRTES